MNISQGRIPVLDGIRGMAIVGVMLNHFLLVSHDNGPWWWTVFTSGYLGVDLFFVLSGFLITNILLENRAGKHYFQGFYARRVLRIFPLYYLSIFLVWVMVRFIEQHPERMVGYDSLFWYWTYLSNFAVSLKQTWTYQSDYLALNHFWSLAIEEQFYLVWPLLIYFGTRRQLVWILLGLLMVATPARYLADHFYGPWSLASTLMTPCRLDALAAGSLLALAVQSPRAQPWLSSKPLLYGTMGVLSAATLNFVLVGGPHIKSTVYSLFFAVAILIALQDRGWIQAILSHPFLLEMGKYSYALYIFHHFFKPAYLRLFGYMLFGMMPEWIAQLLYMAITFTITYGLSLLSWRYIEQPILRLKDRFPY